MARRVGKNGLFTYDFGVAIAQGTVLRIGKMTSAVTALAGAMYFLNRSATAYVKTLNENTMQFGGIYNTMQKMQEAQNRIIKGQTAFNVDDQMKGMNMLMSIGLDAEKQFEFVNKAAHAMGQSFSGFSGAIAAGINGDMSAMVQMGLLTQRAAKRFDIYHAGTVQRQQAIMEFLQSHQGVANAIANDFRRVNDSVTQLGGTFKQFILDIIGDPKNPNSLYAKAVEGIDYIAEAFKRNIKMIRQWGERIGEVLGWAIKTFGKFVVYLGRQFNRFFGLAAKASKSFAEGTKSLIVSLEFLKLRVKAVFDTVFDWMVEHKNFIKWLGIAFAGIFAINTVARWAGAIAAALRMLNPYVLAITGLITGLLFALDRFERAIEKSRDKQPVAAQKIFKDPEILPASKWSMSKDGLSPNTAALLATALKMRDEQRIHGYETDWSKIGIAAIDKRSMEFFGKSKPFEIYQALYQEIVKANKNGLAFFAARFEKGIPVEFTEDTKKEGFTTLVGEQKVATKADDGTIGVKNSVDEAKSVFEKMLPSVDGLLESIGVNHKDSTEIRKAVEEGFKAVNDKLSYVGGNNYNINVKAEGDVSDKMAGIVTNAVRDLERRAKMANAWATTYQQMKSPELASS